MSHRGWEGLPTNVPCCGLGRFKYFPTKIGQTNDHSFKNIPFLNRKLKWHEKIIFSIIFPTKLVSVITYFNGLIKSKKK